MTVRFVCSILGENIGPTARYLESVITHSQEFQNTLCRVIDAGKQIAKFFEFMQCLI